mmetsp:Transcript_800/g.3088  ORF Transcript_800/g.3088 Transcript_800/m.3088 type:complete len:274 (-) Transcript_800:574-1395(-)
MASSAASAAPAANPRWISACHWACMGLGAADDGAAHLADFSHSRSTCESVGDAAAIRSSGVASRSARKLAPAASASATADSLISTPAARIATAAAVRMANRRAADEDPPDVTAPPVTPPPTPVSVEASSSSSSPGGRQPGHFDEPSPPATSPRSSSAAPRAPLGAPDDSSTKVWSSTNAEDRAFSNVDGYSLPSSDLSAGESAPRESSRRLRVTMARSAFTAAVLASAEPCPSNAVVNALVAAFSAFAHASTWSASPPSWPVCLFPAATSPAT